MKHALQLEAPNVGFESLRVVVNISRGRLVSLAFREFEEFRCVRDTLGGTVDFASIGGQFRAFASQFLRPLGLRPDGRILELTADLFEAFFLIVVLKETPVRRRCAPRGL
jgi:hypothetical protein